MSIYILNMFFCCLGSFLGVVLSHYLIYIREENKYNEFVEDTKND